MMGPTTSKLHLRVRSELRLKLGLLLAQCKSFTIRDVCECVCVCVCMCVYDLQPKQTMFMWPCILFPNLVTDVLSCAVSVREEE